MPSPVVSNEEKKESGSVTGKSDPHEEHAAEKPSNKRAAPVIVEMGNGNEVLSFSNASVRAGFIRKVFTLVTIMLLVVTAMCSVPFLNENVRHFAMRHQYLIVLSCIVNLVVYLILVCCEGPRRTFPCNIILLVVLCLSMGLTAMLLCSVYSATSVLLSLVITTICCANIILLASVTKLDFTNMMGIALVISLVLCVFSIVAVFAMYMFHVTWLYMVYAGLSALACMFYLAIDIQLIIGGKKHEISPEDYILATVAVFTDIVYMFIYIVQLIGNN